MVEYQGIERNVMSLVGATPDAIVKNSEGRIVAVIEAKSRCPFVLGGVTACGLQTVHTASRSRQSLSACMYCR